MSASDVAFDSYIDYTIRQSAKPRERERERERLIYCVCLTLTDCLLRYMFSANVKYLIRVFPSNIVFIVILPKKGLILLPVKSQCLLC